MVTLLYFSTSSERDGFRLEKHEVWRMVAFFRLLHAEYNACDDSELQERC